jgi:hypothetical protein
MRNSIFYKKSVFCKFNAIGRIQLTAYLLLWAFNQLSAQGPLIIVGNAYLNLNNSNAISVGQLPTPSVAPGSEDLVYSGSSAQLSQGIQFDSDGQLLFFAIDGKIYDRDGYLMVSSEIGNTEPYPSYPEQVADINFILIPGQCDKFYVILGDKLQLSDVFSCAILDLSLENQFWPGDPLRRGALINLELYATDNEDAIEMYGLDFSSFISQNDDEGIVDQHIYSAIDELFIGSSVGVGFSSSIHIVDSHSATNKKLIVGKGNLGWICDITNEGIFWSENQDCIGFSNVYPKWNDEITVTNFQNNYYVFYPNEGNISFNLSRYNSDWDQTDCWPSIAPNNPFGSLPDEVSSSCGSGNGRYIYFMTISAPYLHYWDMNDPDAGWSVLTSITSSTDLSNLVGCQMLTSTFEGEPSIYLFHSEGISIIKNCDTPSLAAFIADPFPSLEVPLLNTSITIGQQQLSSLTYFDEPVIVQARSTNPQTAIELQASVCCTAKIEFGSTGNFNITNINDGSWNINQNPFNVNSGSVYISGLLTFESGSNTTISGMEFRFGPEGRVLIEAGAAVTLNNCLWTSYECEGVMWPGVRIEGTNNIAISFNNISQEPMQNGNQGYLRMNSSTIENAILGVLVGDVWTADDPNVDLSVSGGILRTSNSTFHNNERDVYISPYVYYLGNGNQAISNKCQFRNTNFITTADLKNSELHPLVHVTLVKVNDIKFINCSFINSTTVESSLYFERGSGIISFLSGLRVYETSPGASNPTYSSIFQGLYHAIYQFGMNTPLAKLECRDASFMMNMYGILNYNSDFSVLYRNYFLIPEIPAALQIIPGNGTPNVVRGIYLTNSTGYIVEQNYFNSLNFPSIPDPFPSTIGIWVDNSGEFSNEIRNNDFNAMKLGIYITRDNLEDLPIVATQTGLELKCNTFTNGQADIFRDANTTIREDQGGGAEYAGNRFSSALEDCEVHGDFIIDPDNTVYNNYFCTSDDISIPDCGSIPGEDLDGDGIYGSVSDDDGDLLRVYTNPDSYDESFCAENFPINGVVSNPNNIYLLMNNIVAKKSQISIAISNYTAVIDNHSTNEIIAELTAAFPNESQFLRDLMLQSHPLSNVVLERLIENAGLLNSWHLTEVFLANSPLDKYLLESIEDAEILSPFYLNFLYQADHGLSLRKVMEMEITHLASEKDRLLRDLASTCIFRSDTDSVHHHLQIADAIKNEPYVASARYYVGYLISAGRYADARQWISEYPELSSMADLINIFETNNGNITSLSTAQTTTLLQIAQDPMNSLSSDAKSLLLMQNMDLGEPIPNFPLQFRSGDARRRERKIADFTGLQVYPNPVNDEAHISYPIELDGVGTLDIYDSVGRLVLQTKLNHNGVATIATKSLAEGLYEVVLAIQGHNINQIKMSVFHN